MLSKWTCGNSVGWERWVNGKWANFDLRGTNSTTHQYRYENFPGNPEKRKEFPRKMSSDHTNPPGLVVSTTEPILSFLTSASTDPHLSQELQQIASNLSSKPNVPYKSLRALWLASNVSTRPQLVQLFSGSEFVLTSPKPREKVRTQNSILPFFLFLVCL